MLRTFQIVLLLTISSSAFTQKVKFTLEWDGETQYTGTMNPNWFEEVVLRPPGNDKAQLEGSEGLMSGGENGQIGFIYEKNKTGTKQKFMLRTSNGWYPVEKMKLKGDKLMLKWDWGFTAPPTPTDLEILRAADELLASEKQWNRVDDRRCDDDFLKNEWGLYCLLMQASVNETGDFNHRSAALKEVRDAIMELRPEKEYQHRLMDFNNEEEFATIKELIGIAIEKILAKLDR